MDNRKKLKLNIKFENGVVICAKSPGLCKKCKDVENCERVDVYYYLYSSNDIEECFKNNYKKR